MRVVVNVQVVSKRHLPEQTKYKMADLGGQWKRGDGNGTAIVGVACKERAKGTRYHCVILPRLCVKLSSAPEPTTSRNRESQCR